LGGASFVFLLILLIFGTVCSATAQTPGSLPREVSLATHAVGSAYYAIGSSLAKVLTEKSPIKFTVKAFAGPSAWAPLLNRGEVDTGVASIVDVTWAYTSGPGHPEPNANMRLLFMINPIQDAMPLTVLAKSNIYKIQDLKGKRVAYGYPGNIMWQQMITAMLFSGGLTWDDVKKVPVIDTMNGINMLKQRQLDAAAAAVPIAAIQELNSTTGVRTLSFIETKESLKKLQELMPGSELGILKAGRAPFITEEVKTVWHWTSLSARATLSDEAAYTTVKTLWDNDKDVRPLHKWLNNFSRDTMFNTATTLPYHQGAIKFYKEKGLWTPQMEELQQKLLKEAK